MKLYKIEISQNGWEYTGYVFIECNTINKTGFNEVTIEDKYKISFDEEIGNIIEINKDDEDYSFNGSVFK